MAALYSKLPLLNIRPVHSVGSMIFVGSEILQFPRVVGSGRLTGFMNSRFGVGSGIFGGVSVYVDNHVKVGVGVQVLEVQEV